MIIHFHESENSPDELCRCMEAEKKVTCYFWQVCSFLVTAISFVTTTNVAVSGKWLIIQVSAHTWQALALDAAATESLLKSYNCDF